MYEPFYNKRGQKYEIPITSSPYLDGYEIVDQIGPVFGEVAYGASFMESLTNAFSNTVSAVKSTFSSQDMAGFTDLLNNAHDYAVDKMIQEAKRRGANAIIGVQVSASELATMPNLVQNSALCAHVSLFGTAVKVNKVTVVSDYSYPDKKARLCRILSKNENDQVDVQKVFVQFDRQRNNALVAIGVKKLSGFNLKSVMADIKFTSIFEEEKEYKKIPFFDLAQNEDLLLSTFSSIEMDENFYRSIESVEIITHKYVSAGSRMIGNDEDDTVSEENTISWLEEIERMTSCDEILKYLTDMGNVMPDITNDYFFMDKVRTYCSSEKNGGLGSKVKDCYEYLTSIADRYYSFVNGKIELEIQSNGNTICPICEKGNKAGRTTCFNCGMKFQKE